MIFSLPKVLDHAKMYDIFPNKSLGQNFILDINFCKKIIQHEIIQGQNILEIGPGLGSLTRAILDQSPKRLLCLEKDRKCIRVLDDISKIYNNLAFIEVDALDYIKQYKMYYKNISNKNTVKNSQTKENLGDEEELKNKLASQDIDDFNYHKNLVDDLNEFKIDSIISNLPYNVGNRIIIEVIQLVTMGAKIRSMTFMVQKEVADRILSPYGSKIYGQLSVLVQSMCNVTRIMNVSPDVFHPAPKVMSTVLHFCPKIMDEKSSILFKEIKLLTTSGFGQRRKIIKTSMKNFLKYIPENMWHLRAENLTVEDYMKIANSMIKA